MCAARLLGVGRALGGMNMYKAWRSWRVLKAIGSGFVSDGGKRVLQNHHQLRRRLP